MAHHKENCFLWQCSERRKYNRTTGEPTCPYRVELTWCHSEKHKEKWLVALYRNRVAVSEYRKDEAATSLECPHCGKVWHGTVSLIRRVAGSIMRHKHVCGERTPAKRRWANRKALRERTGARKPVGEVKIVDNPGHLGLKD